MPRIKRLSAYPAEYHEIVDKVVQEGGLTIPAEDELSARALRLSLYGFKAAYIDAAAKGEADAEKALLLDGYEIAVSSEDKTKVEVRPRGSRFLKGIKKALET